MGTRRSRSDQFRNRRPRQHRDRSARRSPDHEPQPGNAALSPFLGVNNWQPVTSGRPAVLTVVFFGYLGWKAGRRRSPDWLLIVGIAAFFAGALDPLASW